MAESTLFVGESSFSCKVADVSQVSALSKERLEILKLISKKPMYSAEIARELSMPEQTVYYHMRALVSAGLVELAGFEQKQGGTAKRYSFGADSLGLVFSQASAKGLRVSRQSKLPSFLAPFVRNGVFDGHFVLGSPDPHGQFRSRGSEFCAMEAAMYFGGFCSFEYPLYYLDTEISAESRRGNLVALGGPKVNTLVNEMNDKLPIRFEKGFSVHSALSGKKYTEDVGVVQVAPNPFNPKSRVLVISGNSHHGTRVGVLGLLRHYKELEKGNAFAPDSIAKVFAGFDEDSDGIVDTVEVLE